MRKMRSCFLGTCDAGETEFGSHRLQLDNGLALQVGDIHERGREAAGRRSRAPRSRERGRPRGENRAPSNQSRPNLAGPG